MNKFYWSILFTVFTVVAGIYPNFVSGKEHDFLDKYSQFRGNPPFIIANFEILKQGGGVIEGKYNLVNEFPQPFADVEIVYAIERYASETKKYGTEESGATEVTNDIESQIIVSQSEPTVFVAPNQTINKSFQIKYPLDFEPFGNYRLKISFNVLSDSFLPVRQHQFPINFSGDSKSNQMQSSCYLVDRDSDKYYPADPKAPDIYFFSPSVELGVQCLFSNLNDLTSTIIPRIEMKNRNFPGETNVVFVKDVILAPEGFSIDFPSFSKIGFYEGKIDFFDKETNLMIVRPANFYFRMGVDPEEIISAKITLLKLDKDYYKKRGVAKVHLDYDILKEKNDKALLPPEVSLVLKMENSKGELCGESQKDVAPRLVKEDGDEFYDYPTEEIDLPVGKKCADPKLTASIFDKDNNELTALVSQIKTQGQRKNNFAVYLAIFLLGLAVVFFFVKKKKAAYLLLIPVIGFGFFFIGASPARAGLQYMLSVSKAGNGSGTVISSPFGINCGNDCWERFNAFTSVTLNAIPSAGSVIGSWYGIAASCGRSSTCTFFMDTDKQASVSFFGGSSVEQYTLSVSKTGTGDGTVTSNPFGINCGGDCSEQYSSDTSVTLTAAPSAGSVFVGWSGDCSGVGSCSLIMNADKSVVATFYASQSSGAISASPNPCIIVLPAITCTSTITWSTADAPNACVFAGNTSFVCNPSGSRDATQITIAGTTFYLRTENRNIAPLLASVYVYGALPQPDLIVQSLSFSPLSPQTGNLMTFSGIVRNRGGATADASQTGLAIDVGNDGSWDVKPPDQSTGVLISSSSETKTWSNAWTATVGTHKFRICADATSDIIESNEGNNCDSATFRVNPKIKWKEVIPR